jgi:hypothetical protein
MAKCGCKPGTRENGWMEQRSRVCLEKEIQAFKTVIKKWMNNA